jgi:hypothetical protein
MSGILMADVIDLVLNMYQRRRIIRGLDVTQLSDHDRGCLRRPELGSHERVGRSQTGFGNYNKRRRKGIASHERAEMKTANEERQKAKEKLEGENSGQYAPIATLTGRIAAQKGHVAR